MKKTIAGFMLTMFVLSGISSLAGSVTTHAQILEARPSPALHILASNAQFGQEPQDPFGKAPPQGTVSLYYGTTGPSPIGTISPEYGLALVHLVPAQPQGYYISTDLALKNCSGPMPMVNRVEISRAASATNPNIVTYLSVPIDPPPRVKGRTIRITNVRANVTTDIAQSIISNPNGLTFTVFTSNGQPSGTLQGALNQVTTDQYRKLLGQIDLPAPCKADGTPASGGEALHYYKNEVVGGFNLIREDSKPDNFNTYGVDFSFTHHFQRKNTLPNGTESSTLSRVGVTADFAVNFRRRGGVDLTKTSELGGVTIEPFNRARTTDNVTISTHALFGVSHLKSSFGSVSTSDNSFAMKFGAAVDVNVNQRFFIRPIGVDYAPTFFGNTTQNNVQFTFGAGVRF